MMISIRAMLPSFLLFLVVDNTFLAYQIDAKSSSGNRRPQRFLKGQKSTKTATCAKLQFSDIFVFGDSLSDQGNFASVAPIPPRSATNGKFAVEYIAEHFDLDLEMSNHLVALSVNDTTFITGNNYAVVSGEAKPEGPFNTPTQVKAFMLQNPNGAPPDALYIVMVGGNDVLAAYDDKYLFDTNKTDEELFQDVKFSARSVIEFTVQPLINAGAKNIVVVGAPSAGETPFVNINQPAERGVFTGHAAEEFNNELDEALHDIECVTGTNIVHHHPAKFTEFIKIGLQIESPCTIGFVGVKGSDPVIPPLGGGSNFPYIWDSECLLPDASGFAFYDELHPTDVVHEYIAGQMIDQICVEMYPGKIGNLRKKACKGTKSSKGEKSAKSTKVAKGAKGAKGAKSAKS